MTAKCLGIFEHWCVKGPVSFIEMITGCVYLIAKLGGLVFLGKFTGHMLITGSFVEMYLLSWD